MKLKWEWKLGELFGSTAVTAILGTNSDTGIAVSSYGERRLIVAIHQPQRLPDSDSEEIEVRFDDEAIETISVRIRENGFMLLDSEEFNKRTGNYNALLLARRLTRHSKFRLRHKGITLVFDYDNASVPAIAMVLGYCGIEL